MNDLNKRFVEELLINSNLEENLSQDSIVKEDDNFSSSRMKMIIVHRVNMIMSGIKIKQTLIVYHFLMNGE